MKNYFLFEGIKMSTIAWLRPSDEYVLIVSYYCSRNLRPEAFQIFVTCQSQATVESMGCEKLFLFEKMICQQSPSSSQVMNMF
jgi:hypothetical protein